MKLSEGFGTSNRQAALRLMYSLLGGLAIAVLGQTSAHSQPIRRAALDFGCDGVSDFAVLRFANTPHSTINWLIVDSATGKPCAPTAVSATGGSTSIIVKFGPPTSIGSSPIAGYSAACTSFNGGVAGSSAGGASAISIRVPGLTNGKGYRCTATASNAQGVGAPSALTNEVTPSGTTSTLVPLLLN